MLLIRSIFGKFVQHIWSLGVLIGCGELDPLGPGFSGGFIMNFDDELKAIGLICITLVSLMPLRDTTSIGPVTGTCTYSELNKIIVLFLCSHTIASNHCHSSIWLWWILFFLFCKNHCYYVQVILIYREYICQGQLFGLFACNYNL